MPGPADARDLRHVGGQRHRYTLRQRGEHLAERADAALAGELDPMVAGAADGADAEMLGRDRVDLAVAVAGDEHLEGEIAAHENGIR